MLSSSLCLALLAGTCIAQQDAAKHSVWPPDTEELQRRLPSRLRGFRVQTLFRSCLQLQQEGMHPSEDMHSHSLPLGLLEGPGAKDALCAG